MKLLRKKTILLLIPIFTFLLIASSIAMKKTVFVFAGDFTLRYDPDKTTLFVGESYQLELFNNNNKVLDKKIKREWKSSDKNIISVNKKGKVKGKKPGKAFITVNVNGNIFSLIFTIKKKPDSVKKTKEEKAVIKKMKELKIKKLFKEGDSWNNEKTYFCDANNTEGFGCAALAFNLSDLLFGKDAPFTQVDDISDIKDKIRIGDIIRVEDDSHSALVIDRDMEGVTLVEGNFTYNDKVDIIHWGERYTYEELEKKVNYYQTRYPR